MLLTLTTTHDRRPISATCSTRTRRGCRRSSCRSARRTSSIRRRRAERCTAALLLDVDPVGLVRGRKGPAGEGFALEQYVNDRPYVASSFLSVAIAQVFGSALARPEQGPAGAGRHANAADGQGLGASLPRRRGLSPALFEPLGYAVTATRHAARQPLPGLGRQRRTSPSSCRRACRLSDLLTHLYVLIPVLDDDKHYWVGDDEVEKLLRHGEGWLAAHPEREAIANRYLKHRRSLMRQTLARLVEEDQLDPDEEAEAHEPGGGDAREADQPERGASGHASSLRSRQRRRSGCSTSAAARGSSCRRCWPRSSSRRSSASTCPRGRSSGPPTGCASSSCRRSSASGSSCSRARLTYRDKRLQGFDAAAVVEVIEHLDPPRLAAFARVLFECARPRTVVLTTPNAEYNVRFENLPAGTLRHKDHRFEWTRAEFQTWATASARASATPCAWPDRPERSRGRRADPDGGVHC